jgi:alpha-beta hydrolase superfamily lysophospholipase
VKARFPDCDNQHTTMASDQDFNLETPSGTIYGSLVVPDAAKNPPVALIIAGSGPTDRNCNSPQVRTDAYLLLARELASRGVASVRYDKRGIAASAAAATAESALRFETYVDDAAAWLRKIADDGRFRRITIIGHSEGSLIGMLAAQRARADAYVSIAGAGFPAAIELRRQMDASPAATPEIRAANERILTSLTAGKTTTDVPPDLLALYRPSVQPYLISWFKYDPRAEIAKLRVPVEVVQGTADIQVSVDDAKALMQGVPAAKLIVIEGMTHVLKHAIGLRPAQQVATVYRDPSIPLDPALVPALAPVVLPG